MHSTSKHALLRLAVSVTVVAAVAVAWAGSAFAATGTLEICKSSLNGMSGKIFQYSVNGGPTITVKGGRCTGPMASTPSGNVVITELATDPATDVAAVRVSPSARNISQDLANRKVTVSVPAGSTASNETRVTFVNQPAGGNRGDLKICKLSETPAFWGRQFTFTVNGGPAISTEANPLDDSPANWSCRLAGSFQVGTVVTVQELIPSGAEVAFIDTDPMDRLVDFDTSTGTLHATIGSGVTVALFDNEAPAPQGQGYLEVCKDAARSEHWELDEDVTGSFDFTITDAAGDEQEVSVLVGQCSAPLLVAAGVAHIQEAARSGYELVNTFTIPEDRWLGENLINGTADVEVPVSEDANDETQVHFVNKRQRAQLKICKALGPGSADLIGRSFRFEVDDPGGRDEVVYIKAAASTQCKIVEDYPIGSELEIDESLSSLEDGEYIKATSPGCSPDEDGDLECNLTIRPGINTVTITNQALGKLEICKFVQAGGDIDEGDEQPTGDEANHQFVFHIDGGPGIKVKPGKCTPPKLVSVGNHTIKEDAELNYDLVDIDVTPETAEVSENLLGRTVTVKVPFAGDLPDDPNFDEDQLGQEVRVDFTNRTKSYQIKVCKHVSPGSTDALGKTTFEFHVSVPGENDTFTLYLKGGECALATQDGKPESFPVILANGDPNTFTVTEVGSNGVNGYIVSSVTAQGVRGLEVHCLAGGPLCNGADTQAVATPGPNTNTVHFTNKSVDP